MAFKTFDLTDDQQVSIYKRKGSRSIRLSVTANGAIRVSIPTWTPYLAGLQFAKSRLDWIAAQQKSAVILKNGQAVGKAHHLQLIVSPQSSRISSRVVQGSIIVRYPGNYMHDSDAVQKVARAACIRALRTQAERLLPQRIAALAHKHDFTYQDASIKQLRSRWGSCDQNKHIVLNLFLMQLPWELIDYVLLHELAHTQHLHHGPDFWGTMEQITPALKDRRKAMRLHQPQLQAYDI